MCKIPKNKKKDLCLNTKKWVYHLLLDYADGDIKLIASQKNISNFVNVLVKK